MAGRRKGKARGGGGNSRTRNKKTVPPSEGILLENPDPNLLGEKSDDGLCDVPPVPPTAMLDDMACSSQLKRVKDAQEHGENEDWESVEKLHRLGSKTPISAYNKVRLCLQQSQEPQTDFDMNFGNGILRMKYFSWFLKKWRKIILPTGFVLVTTFNTSFQEKPLVQLRLHQPRQNTPQIPLPLTAQTARTSTLV